VSTISLTRAIPKYGSFHAGRWIQLAYILTDVFFVVVNGLILYAARTGGYWLVNPERGQLVQTSRLFLPNDYLAFMLIYVCLIVLFCKNRGLYGTPRDRSALDETIAVFQAVTLVTIVIAAFLYLSKQEVSRLVVTLATALNIFALSGWRIAKRRMIERRVAKGYGTRNVLIIGAGKIGQQLARYIDENRCLGFVVRGFLDENHLADPRILGRVEDLAHVARAHFIDELFVTIPWDREMVKSVAFEARKQRLDVRVVPDLYDGLAWHAPIGRIGDLPVMSLHWEPIPVLGLFVKRMIDILGSALGLIVLLPFLLEVAIAIKLGSPGPVFYRSYRIGKKGTKFVCLKFRTMVKNAEELKENLRHLNERNGPLFKMTNDPRLTRLGKWLRKYSVDELPQLWNVLKGDMSLVGPRPPSPDETLKYSLEHLRRLDVTPGLTGLWQIKARQDPSFDTYVSLDLQYIENWDLWTDIKILLRTVPAVFSGCGT
jgi:exopolysaccharide biosynthesis polyprenyl glycosylphosphotransferase